MSLEKKEVTTYKWTLRTHRPSSIGRTVTEQTTEIKHDNTFEKYSTGFFFAPPANTVLDAETLRSVADHLDSLNKDFTVEEPEKKPEGQKKAKQSFTMGH